MRANDLVVHSGHKTWINRCVIRRMVRRTSRGAEIWSCDPYALDLSFQSSCTGANFDIFRSFSPYLMKINGTGKASAATPPRILMAGPTPRWLNMGRAASGRPPAIKLRKNVLADTAEAA